MIGLRVVLFALLCIVVLVLLMVVPVWLRALRTATRAAPQSPVNGDSADGEPVNFVEGEFRHIDTQ